MTNLKRLTVIALCVAGSAGLSAQTDALSVQTDTLPVRWDLQTCIDYALKQNITVRKNRLNAEGAQVDVKTARAALFPSLSASVSQRVVNRPNSETNTVINGDNITSSQSKTSYNGSYGIDANSAQQQYAAAAEKLKSTQTSYDLIQERFNLGMQNTVELLTEKNNLLSARQETLQAKYMAVLNRQLLRFYQGESIAL